MNSKNIHKEAYDFEGLISSHHELEKYVFINDYKSKTIDFANNKAVLHLNKAILIHHYRVSDWNIPEDYLCPPIPSRADYIHYIADLLEIDTVNSPVKGLDIGVGANCIYPILASQIYNWKMIGVDINKKAVDAALININYTENLKNNIQIRHQKNNANIFEEVINKDEYFHFSMCNPPFHSSEEDASKGTLRKLKNLQQNKSLTLNFGGQANELWCNGGEALFIKRMIKQSIHYKLQVGWFTTLVSKKENLFKIYKQLNKLKVIYKTIEMKQGSKQSRFVAWKFK